MKIKRQIRYSADTATAVMVLLWFFCLPEDLFEGTSYSTVVTDCNGELLGARIADDGQWRFLLCDSLPEKFAIALIEFEDRTFYSHPGISAGALVRASIQNISHGSVVSGASTITMQVVRMSRRKSRNVWQKMVEMFLATRIESRYTKDEILRLYGSHAPFGGNVVGINAAMWRYLGHDGSDLSWAEAATLAVLQNVPSSINLAKNRDTLLFKRNRLLHRLMDKGHLSEFDYKLALEEPLIDKPFPLPQQASHLVEWYDRMYHGKKSSTGIKLSLQRQVEDVTDKWSKELRTLSINDLAVVIMDVRSREIIAYCGNADMNYHRQGMFVDIANSPRSSGSILKPLLYCAALQEGTILPQTLLPDVPVNFGGFSPKNFDMTFSGAVAADEALARSLNVPNVHLLKEYGVMRFAELLKQGGITSLNRPADQYGLSLILGSAEVTLREITAFYATMAAYYQYGNADTEHFTGFPLTDKIALYHTFEALKRVNRPDQLDWRRVVSVQNIAWKTGTSYGSRDAWAIGITPHYAVGVWVGNAEGGGSPGLTGARTAGPVMFDLFNLLPKHSGEEAWFIPPNDAEGESVVICRHSGHLAGHECTDTVRMLLPRKAKLSNSCPYHQSVIVSLDGKYRIADRSEPVKKINRFVLLPAMEWYYKQIHPGYESLPPFKSGSMTDETDVMRFIYPDNGIVISLPHQMNGEPGEVTFSLAHSNPATELFWHLDREYIG
ncbi:MAG: penicillin-binding protein 1C, partial [Dysgonamonadaceae bacterium]|nr:penicillin-binding protein 1C [Dysgonamonadaceae bacterium]